MALSQTTINTAGSLTTEVKDCYEKNLMVALRDELCLYNYASKKTIGKNNGKTLKWRVMKALSPATTALSEGVTPVANKLSVMEFSATVAQYGSYLRYSDVLSEVSIDPIIMDMSTELGAQGGATVETLIMDKLVTGCNVVYSGSAGARSSVTATISLADIDRIYKKLKKANVKKINGKYIAVVSEDILTDLKGLTGSNASWLDIAKYADPKSALNGDVIEFRGFYWISSNYVKDIKSASTVTSPDLQQCLFFGADAFGVVGIDNTTNKPALIYKPIGSAGADDPLNQRGTVGWKLNGFAVRILRDEALIRYEVKPSTIVSVSISDSDRTGYVETTSGSAD